MYFVLFFLGKICAKQTAKNYGNTHAAPLYIRVGGGGGGSYPKESVLLLSWSNYCVILRE